MDRVWYSREGLRAAQLNRSTHRVSRLWQVETRRATPTCTHHLHARTDLLGHTLTHIHIHACEAHCTHLQGNNPASPMLQEKLGFLQLLTKCKSSQFISERSPVLYANEAPLQCCWRPRVLLVTQEKSLQSHFLSEEQQRCFKWNTQETCGCAAA